MNDITDITNNTNVNVYYSGSVDNINNSNKTIIIDYRLETRLFRYIGFSANIKEGSPIGNIDSGNGFVDNLEYVMSFGATTHHKIHEKLKQLFPEELI